MTDPLRNPKDPLHKVGPEAEKELFRRLGQACNEFPREAVIGAAMNLLVNVIRQEHATRARAETAFDDIAGRAKNILLEQHYDLIGNRRNVFPFHQNIDMPLANLRGRH